MIRAVLLCALVICAQGVDLSASKVKYAQRARSLRKGVEQLEADVNTTVLTFDEDLQYLLLLGVVLETASEADNKPTDDVMTILIRVLETKVPDIMEKPKQTVDELYKVVDETLDLADPLFKVMDDVGCDDSADDPCNRVVDKLVQSDTDLQDSAAVLDVAGQVADAYLAKQSHLKDVANRFEVIPYLLQNEESVKDSVELLILLLDTVYPDKNRTD